MVRYVAAMEENSEDKLASNVYMCMDQLCVSAGESVGTVRVKLSRSGNILACIWHVITQERHKCVGMGQRACIRVRFNYHLAYGDVITNSNRTFRLVVSRARP